MSEKPTEKITVTHLHYESRLVPTVLVGKTADGWTIHVRYRWGRLVIRLDYREPPPNGGAAGAWIYDQQLDPAGLAGCLSYDELRGLTDHIINWPDDEPGQACLEGEDLIL